MHTPIRSLPLRADYDLTTVYGSALHYFAKSVVLENKNTMLGKADKTLQNSALQGISEQENFMIRVLFICHGNILKSLEKACKINRFTKQIGTYYTTTTPFFQ